MGLLLFIAATAGGAENEKNVQKRARLSYAAEMPGGSVTRHRSGEKRRLPIALANVIIYTFCVHNHSAMLSISQNSGSVVRPAHQADVEQIWELVSCYTAQGLMLPRSHGQIAMNIDNYVVATVGGRVAGCAALEEYSPSLAEIASVAVAATEHGNGLGTEVVMGVERLARARSIAEVFALSLSERFFLSMGYEPTSIARYPEKLARYDVLMNQGVEIVPKPCFQKRLGNIWPVPALVPGVSLERALRAS